MNLETKYKL